MTYLKPPGSIEQALDRISGVIDWASMASIVERTEGTVRHWANPATPESVPLTLAIRLDLAWQAAGQIGAPLLNAYMALVDKAREAEFGCQIELTRATAVFARENGQAEEAALMLTLPDADEADFVKAEQEVEHVVAHASGMLGLIRRLRRSRQPP